MALSMVIQRWCQQISSWLWAVAAISRAALKAGRPVPVIATCAHAGPRVVRNPTLRWLPSQNGLLADAPHRQSATRVSCLTSVWS